MKFIPVQVLVLDERHPPCGGCGLKFSFLSLGVDTESSPSMRRVWIEIQLTVDKAIMQPVTLHAEGVD